MTIAFFETTQRDLSNEILSFLPPKVLFEKCFTLKRGAKIELVLHLLRRGRSALFFQKELIEHWIKNPEQCSFLRERADEITNALKTLSKRPYLDNQTREYTLFLRAQLRNKELSPHVIIIVTNVLSGSNETEQRKACYFISALANTLTNEHIERFSRMLLSLSNVFPTTSEAIVMALRALPQRQSIESRFEGLRAELEQHVLQPGFGTLHAIEAWAYEFSREQNEVLISLIEPLINNQNSKVYWVGTKALMALLQAQSTTLRFEKFTALLKSSNSTVLQITQGTLKRWAPDFNEEQRKVLWTLIEPYFLRTQAAIAGDALKALLQHQNNDIRFDGVMVCLEHPHSLLQITACNWLVTWVNDFQEEQRNVLWSNLMTKLQDTQDELQNALVPALAALLGQQNIDTRFNRLQDWLQHPSKTIREHAYQSVKTWAFDFSEEQCRLLWSLAEADLENNDNDSRLKWKAAIALIALLKHQPHEIRINTLILLLKHSDSLVWNEACAALVIWATSFNEEECKPLWALVVANIKKCDPFFFDVDSLSNALLALAQQLSKKQLSVYLLELIQALKAANHNTEPRTPYAILAAIAPCLNQDYLEEWQACLPFLIEGLRTENLSINVASLNSIRQLIHLNITRLNQSIQDSITHLLTHSNLKVRERAFLLANYLLEYGLSCSNDKTLSNGDSYWHRAIESLHNITETNLSKEETAGPAFMGH